MSVRADTIMPPCAEPPTFTVLVTNPYISLPDIDIPPSPERSLQEEEERARPN
jgi:hypothetical protein